MGVYGIDFYAGTRFGRDPSLVRADFSIYPFTSQPMDYGSLSLTWVKPQAPTCTQLRLVRNKFSLPQNENDGAVLFTSSSGGTPNYFDQLVTAGFTYYTMWGWDSVNSLWIRSGDLIAVVPFNWGYSDQLYRLLPGMYRDRDFFLVNVGNADSLIQTTSPPLQRFFQLLGFQMDLIRTETESLLLTADPINASGGLLGLMAYQLGIPYEPEMGMQRSREIIANAIHLYKLKGSAQGISEFVATMSGWAVLAVQLGNNRMNSVDDSIMSSSLGGWQLWPAGLLPVSGPNIVWPANYSALPSLLNSGISIARVPNLMSIAGMANPLINLGFTPLNYVNTGMSITKAAGGSAGNATITTGPIPLTAFTGAELPEDIPGIGPGLMPVANGWLTIVFQIFTPASTPGRQVSVGAITDSGFGVGTTTTITTVPGTWTTVQWSGYLDETMGNFLYPLVMVRGMFNASTAETHYATFFAMWALDLDDVAVPPSEADYDIPRDIKIVLQPQRVNLLGNTLTTFVNGVDGWVGNINPLSPTSTQTATLNVVFAPANDTSGLYKVVGTGSLVVQATGYPVTRIFGGAVSTVTTAPVPAGWFIGSDWFNGAVNTYANYRTWFSDPGNPTPWFMEGPAGSGFFMTGTGIQGGAWFASPPPPQASGATVLVPQKNLFYTFSSYIRALEIDVPSTTVYPGFWWHFPDGTTLFSRGPAFTLTTTGFTRPYFSMVTPTQNGLLPDGMLGFLEWDNAPLGATWWVNGAMIEIAPVLGPFFDAATHPAGGLADYFTDTHGATYYYQNRTRKTARLNYWLPQFIPLGATASLVFSASETIPIDVI